MGRSPSALANKLRLLRLSPECCRLLVENGLTERHARALLRLEDEEERLDALRHMIRSHLNVAQTEQYIEKHLARLQATPPAGRRIFLLKDVRLFLNSLDRGLRLIREADVGAEPAGRTRRTPFYSPSASQRPPDTRPPRDFFAFSPLPACTVTGL